MPLISISDVQNSIKAGVRTLAVAAGAVPSAVVWADEARPAAQVLVVLNIVQWGNDIDRGEYIESLVTPGQLTWSMSTLHYIRVQVRCESIFNTPGRDAAFTAEGIRAGLRRPDLVWAAGVVNQPDINTYLHHTSFPHDGHIISCYSFETNFRAVTDFALAGPIPAGTNMNQVEVIGADAAPPAGDQLIDRPV
jgi:hypothetical protein